MKESEFTKQVTDWIDLQGWHWRRNRNAPTPTGKFKGGKAVYRSTGTKGIPDLTVAIPVYYRADDSIFRLRYCQFMDIELKAGKNKPSPEQLQWIESMKMVHAIAIIAYSLDDIKKALTEHGIKYRG